MRLWIASATVLALALEPISSAARETDLGQYAITQGGLLAVALILFYAYRRDALGALSAEQNRSKDLIDLVTNNTTALTRNADALSALARTVEKIEERRHPR